MIGNFDNGRKTFISRSNVSRETIDRLDRFAEILKIWSAKINLVSPASLPYLWSRHIADSTQVYDAAEIEWKTWLDIGTGGGFPGLVVAILDMQNETKRNIVLAESRNRKSEFLLMVIRELGIDASVISKRIETVPALNADIISARAVAPLPSLLKIAVPHLSKTGELLLSKGQNYLSELTAAEHSWKLSTEIIQSRTDANGVILRIREAARV